MSNPEYNKFLEGAATEMLMHNKVRVMAPGGPTLLPHYIETTFVMRSNLPHFSVNNDKEIVFANPADSGLPIDVQMLGIWSTHPWWQFWKEHQLLYIGNLNTQLTVLPGESLVIEPGDIVATLNYV